MGSGETSPTMVTPHQQILASLGKVSELKLSIVDTPFGFQENADDLTEKLIDFFAQSVGAKAGVVSLRDSSVAGAALGEAVNSIRESNWVFAGPGSPSYALKVWQELGVSPHFDEVLADGVVVLASAAALTAGSHTIPVYEMYKVGEDPHWLAGLNLIERHTGMPAAIIPHYDNADGANHDTRFCYIGERRLRVMESLLPQEVFIIGVDEHTGIRFDLDERIAHVFGRGTMTIRHHGESWTVAAGESATFEEIIAHTGSSIVQGEPAPLFKVDPHRVEELLDAGNVTAAVDALLNLDELDRDTETRAAVHSLVTRLGHIAASPKVDIMSVVGPYIEALLQARQAARAGGRWDDADAIRDKLMEMKVTIQDSKEGSTWEIESS
jgi:peptidase E